jgi:predicted DNA-binding transcriptional regulator YafY
MNRIDRLHAITTVLQSKRIVKAEELARKFEVSLRTIYRDIRALEAGGMPIGAEAGIGYFIAEGYHLPPVMFSKEEGRALLMAAKLMEKISDESVSQSFQFALSKVRAVLDNEKKDELQDLEERILVHPFSFGSAPVANPILDQLKEAIIQSRVVEADYFSNYKGENSHRCIEPVGLIFYGTHWHLIGYCRLRQDYRHFRTDRFSSLRVLRERFRAGSHPSLQEYTDRLIQGKELHRVEIKVQESIYRFISDAKYAMGLLQEEEEGEYRRMSFATASLDYFARWLLMMLDKVELVEPPQLKEKLQYFVRLLHPHYCGTDKA